MIDLNATRPYELINEKIRGGLSTAQAWVIASDASGKLCGTPTAVGIPEELQGSRAEGKLLI